MAKAKREQELKTLTILGRTFRIVLTSEELTVEGKPAGAIVDFSSREIKLGLDLTDRDRLIALLHETAHVGLDVSGLDQVLPEVVVESLCQTMANTYYDFLLSTKVVRGD